MIPWVILANEKRRVSGPGVRRHGMITVFLAVVVLILLAVAAFVTDLALTKVVHRGMQSASDTASLEGLRFRDSAVDERAAASLIVRQSFDDDFDFASDAFNYGAGPVVNIVPGVAGTADLGQAIGGYSFYDPILEVNDGTVNPPADRPEGDMLAGLYDGAARHDEGYNPANPYLRDDFMTGPGLNNSFLVRIRRTSDRAVPDFNNIPGVSSSGPEMPLLFGRAIFMTPTAPGAYNPREHGLSFRSTSIADAEPVLSAGPVAPSSIAPPAGLDGVAYYGLTLEFWNALTPNVWQSVFVTASGEISEVGLTATIRDGQFIRRTEVDAGGIGGLPGDTLLTVLSSEGFPAVPFKARIDDELLLVTAVNMGTNEWTVQRGINGTIPALHVAGSLVHLHEAAKVTDPLLSSPALDNGFGTSSSPDFVPVFADISGVERIVGFGGAMIRPAAAQTLPPPVYPAAVEIMRLDSFIPSRNAMAHLADPVDAAIANVDIETAFASRRLIGGPLLAPALVRSYGE